MVEKGRSGVVVVSTRRTSSDEGYSKIPTCSYVEEASFSSGAPRTNLPGFLLRLLAVVFSILFSISQYHGSLPDRIFAALGLLQLCSVSCSVSTCCFGHYIAKISYKIL